MESGGEKAHDTGKTNDILFKDLQRRESIGTNQKKKKIENKRRKIEYKKAQLENTSMDLTSV